MARTQGGAAGPAARRSSGFALGVVAVAGLLVLAAGGVVAYAFREGPAGSAGNFGGAFHLVDQNGKPVSDVNFLGKWQLFYFGYTHCPDACPTTLNNISLAFDKLSPAERKEVGVVFVTVDPARDTPAVMKDYIASFTAPITGLTGTADEVAQAAKDYRVYYAKHLEAGGDYAMDHSSLIYLMDPQGKFATTFTPQNGPTDIAARLEKALS